MLIFFTMPALVSPVVACTWLLPHRGPGLWDEVCSPKMQWWSLLALADMYVINSPYKHHLLRIHHHSRLALITFSASATACLLMPSLRGTAGNSTCASSF